MRYRFTARFERAYRKLPAGIAELFDGKLAVFLKNRFHPSFRTKKIEGFSSPEIWEASLNMNYRLTYQIEDDVLIFRNIGPHSIIDRGKG